MLEIDCLKILRALACPPRLQILKVLLEGDSGVNDLTKRLSLSQYNVSKHLRVLKEAGVVDCRAIGRRRDYFIQPEFRQQIEQQQASELDFGCCKFHLDQMVG
jgi:DNA-binding transcriptional ArsR family regulator